MTATEFAARFPKSNEPGGAYGTWFDDENELVHYYYLNDQGEVGAIKYHRRSTLHEYRTVTGEDADILKHYYRPKP
jgi:hypothetical protein